MDFDKYKYNGPIIQKPTRPRLNAVKANADDARQFAIDLETYDKKLEEWQEYSSDLNKQLGKLSQQFQEDLYIDLGIQDNPKRHLLYSKAYEMGHSAGCSEVYYYASNLVELIQ